MKICSTFNRKLYKFSGRGMIQSVQDKLPNAEVVIYDEQIGEKFNFKTVNVNDLPEVKRVFEENKEVITKPFGGLADGKNMGMWNNRWFGWFKKVAMGYHAVCVEEYKGYLLFIDSDIRFLKGFDEDFLNKTTNGKAVSYFRGDRPIAETSFIVANADLEITKEFYNYYMNLFLSKDFRSFPRWDDSYTFEQAMLGFDQKSFCDLAAGCANSKFTDTNGHTTGSEIIAFTEWGKYVEHDKGIHWRNRVVPHQT